MSLPTEARLLVDVVADLGDAVKEDHDLDTSVHAERTIAAAIAELVAHHAVLSHRIGDLMGRYSVTVNGVGVVNRHKDVKRRNWQSEDLRRMVLDSRLVDPETGEVESHAATLIAVYGCAGYQAKIGQLRARGIDPSEWCDEETRGWKLEIR